MQIMQIDGCGHVRYTYYGKLLKYCVKVFFFFLRILSIFNTHMGRGEKVFFKQTYNGVYPKGSNSWIYNTGF